LIFGFNLLNFSDLIPVLNENNPVNILDNDNNVASAELIVCEK